MLPTICNILLHDHINNTGTLSSIKTIGSMELVEL